MTPRPEPRRHAHPRRDGHPRRNALFVALACLAIGGASVVFGGTPSRQSLEGATFRPVAIDAGVDARDPAPPPLEPAQDPLLPATGAQTVDRVTGPAHANRDAAPAAAPAAVAEVVRFRPRDGSKDESPSADLSVRFTVAMDRAATEAAFTALMVDGEPISGALHWAEGDTVLVLHPAKALAYGARVQLQVATGALSADGVPLDAAASATFTVAAKPAPAPATAPRPATSAAATSTAPSASSGWRWPLMGPITQYFGQSLTKYGWHDGIDIDGQTGDPVHAAHAGLVVAAGHSDGCGGLQVHIDHGSGIVTWYRHLSRIDVVVGQTVQAGTQIGLVGATGCALGSHLHFGVEVGTTFVNPLRYLPPR
jgi:murein DD-endopeptidase MepM/ murein hydrolase activator NlpD